MTPDLASMIQHAVPSAAMTDSADLEQRLRLLVNDIDQAQARVHDLVRERNELMRELHRDHGVRPQRLRELAELNSLPLTYRIVAGENR